MKDGKETLEVCMIIFLVIVLVLAIAAFSGAGSNDAKTYTCTPTDGKSFICKENLE